MRAAKRAVQYLYTTRYDGVQLFFKFGKTALNTPEPSVLGVLLWAGLSGLLWRAFHHHQAMWPR